MIPMWGSICPGLQKHGTNLWVLGFFRRLCGGTGEGLGYFHRFELLCCTFACWPGHMHISAPTLPPKLKKRALCFSEA